MATSETNFLLMKLLSSELTDTELDDSVKEKLTANNVLSLYNLSKHYDLAHTISFALKRNNIEIDSDIHNRFLKEEMLAVFRIQQMKYAYNQICLILNEEEIPYIPLKGSVIRSYYPDEIMRTSCDIDILVKRSDIDSAVAALVKNGYKKESEKYHDVSLFSPNNVHLELHFSIQENRAVLDEVLKDAWDFARPKKGFQFEFSKEFFLFHIFAHSAYHFLHGGCGIKPLMDIWVMENKMGITFEDAKELLERAGIYIFAEKITELSRICFSNKSKDEFSNALLLYIFDGGLYGSTKNRLAVNGRKNVFSYMLGRLFMPYSKMKVLYPVLEKIPVILPFCWIARIFRMLFRGKFRSSVSEIKIINNLSDEKVESVRQIKNKLGL